MEEKMEGRYGFYAQVRLLNYVITTFFLILYLNTLKKHRDEELISV